MTRISRRTALAVGMLAVLAAADSWAGDEDGGVLGEGTGSAVADVLRRFGAEARVLSVEVSPGETAIAVQDPAQRAHVNRHRYTASGAAEAEPLAVGRSERALRARLFPLADVKVDVLPEIIAAATAAVDTEGGAARHVRLDRSEGSGDVASWGPPRWRVYVEGPRGGGYVEFGLDGKRKRVTRW